MKGFCTKCSTYGIIKRKNGKFICTKCSFSVQDHEDAEFKSKKIKGIEKRINS